MGGAVKAVLGGIGSVVGGLLGGSKPKTPEITIPTETKKVEAESPVDAQALANAKLREQEAKARRGRGSLRIDLASGVGGETGVGSGISIA